MKAITLIQPWATLIALNEKKIETRGWKTSYRGPLLIHAGKKIDAEYLKRSPFLEVLNKNGITSVKDIPTGAIIAKCNLVNCLKIENPIYEGGIYKPKLQNGQTVNIHNEFYFGDYTPGRYAWILENIEILKQPILSKGQQRLWNFDFKV